MYSFTISESSTSSPHAHIPIHHRTHAEVREVGCQFVELSAYPSRLLDVATDEEVGMVGARGVEITMVDAVVAIEREPPTVGCERIKRSVVHRCHHLGCIDWTAVFVLHGQYPCLLLTRREFVAEGLPGEAQVGVGLRIGESICVGMNVAVAYISHNDTDAVAVGSLVVDGELVQLAVECEELAFYDTPVCNDGVRYVSIVLAW